MTQREELIKQIANIRCDEVALDNTWVHCPDCVAKLADFIIADRIRVVEPLVKYHEHVEKLSMNRIISSDEDVLFLSEAVNKTMRNAGASL